ncbi:GntR family transcriptional regulator [Psychrobacillus vulpis]|uniref:GntR family transcriptional regulator n=1 Tax=Psychrobacillus vulpis TaxID=2325572 RepID=A0A544TT00_9BACI|nr:GntR family transcriptional regulator [Psychrobacillus vulpis]TQR20563.1 GntR family transcriptional regulator [Psychrobacillus vulpis]
MILISADIETQIIDDIMQQIVSKTIEHGEKLPSENELAKKYKVPRMTVRNALTKLEERGYIYSLQGKGRYLKEESTQIQLHLTGKTSFTDKMKEAGYDLKTHNIICEKISFNEQLFQNVNAGKEDNVYKIGRLRYINDEPIAIHYSYVSEKMFPKIEVDGPKIESMFGYYRKLGYKGFTSKKSLLSITFPTSDEQQLLSCKSMVPLIVVESDCIDINTNKVLEHTKILYRSDKFKYDITMD